MTPITDTDLATLEQRRQNAKRLSAEANQQIGIPSAPENTSGPSQAVLARLMSELEKMGLFPRRRTEAEALILLRMEQYQFAKGDESMKARWPGLSEKKPAKKAKGPYARRVKKAA